MKLSQNKKTINFSSIEEWKKYCFSTHRSYLQNKHFRKWINGKEIQILNFTNLGKNELKCIKAGVEDAIKLGKLHFKASYCSKPYLRIEGGKIKSEKLLKAIVRMRAKNTKEHADILIVDKPVQSSKTLIRDGEALTYVPEGVIIFTFEPSKKYPNNFLRRRAKHESLHLLGLNAHHEDTQVMGYNNDANCIMRYNAPTSSVCGKCRTALKSFWEGIRYATNKKNAKL